MTACVAVLHQPCGHNVCRSHAHCSLQVDDLAVWHPDNCPVCYKLVSTLTSESSTQLEMETARATLKIWVGGFARNVKARQPYILSEEWCSLLYPNAKTSAAVPKALADPIIESITSLLLAPDQGETGATLTEDVATLDLDVEPMALDDPDAGRDEGESGGSRAGIPLPSPAFSSTSDQSSFRGFPEATGTDLSSRPVPPKVKAPHKPLYRTHKSSQDHNPSRSSPSEAKSSSTRVSQDPIAARGSLCSGTCSPPGGII
ncbi:uncharacterized protein [Palaemon carinicauda]|uniref:uncharacterized protein n=1 Tax=Palaemon carinicauda TaxID=392227 RepID=UPI0035B5B4F5